MAVERSWLRVVEVANESRRRFSGRADVMVRFVLMMMKTTRELMCRKIEDSDVLL